MLQAHTSDPIDGADADVVAWASDVQGPLGNGPAIVPVFTVAGPHTIIATATDSRGLTGQAIVHVTVQPAVAVPVITFPTEGAALPLSAAVQLAGSASYGSADIPIDCSQLTWTEAGATNEFTNPVGCAPGIVFQTPGPRKITLTVAPSSIYSGGSVSVDVTIAGANQTVVSIETPSGTPSNPAVVFNGEGRIPLRGDIFNEPQVSCPIPGPGCATLDWTLTSCGGQSSLDLGQGALITAPAVGNGENVITSELTFDPFAITECGTETLTLCVTDSVNVTPLCSSSFLQVLFNK
jgi:hypothetical protein